MKCWGQPFDNSKCQQSADERTQVLFAYLCPENPHVDIQHNK